MKETCPKLSSNFLTWKACLQGAQSSPSLLLIFSLHACQVQVLGSSTSTGIGYGT